MWMLLSGGLRRWIALSVAVPLASKALGSAGRHLEARSGPTRLSRGLVTAGTLVSPRPAPAAPRTFAQRLLHRR